MVEKKTVKRKELVIFNLLYAMLILALPFVYVKTVIDPVLIPRHILLGVFLLIGSIILFFQKQKSTFHFSNKLMVCYAALSVLYVISMLQSVNIVESYFTVSKLFLFSSFFIFTTYLLSTEKLSFSIILKCVVGFSMFIIVSSFMEVLKLNSNGVNIFKEENMYQITSTFGHKNLLSSIMFLCIPFLGAAFISLNKNWKILVAINIVLGMVLIFMLQTRAVIAGIGLAFLITAIITLFLFRGEREKKIVRLIGFAVLMVIIGFSIVAIKYSEKFSLLTKTESARERINIWDNTIQMIKEHPLTGVGAGNWQIHFPKYGLVHFHETNYTITEGLTNFQRPHNDFLWVFSETGFFGFIAYSSIFLLVIIYLIKLIYHSTELQQKFIYLIFLFGILGYIFIALVDFPLERMEHQILLGLILAFVTSSYINTFEKNEKKYSPKWMNYIIVLVGAYGLWVGVNRFEGEKYSYKLIVAHQHGAWEKMIVDGNKAINIFYNMDPFSIPIKWYIGVAEFTLGDLVKAKENFEEAYQIHPYQVHVLHNYATCFEKEGDHEKAIKMFEEMHRISPTFSDGIINLSGAYFNAGKFEDAYKTIITFKWDDNSPKSHEFMKVILAKKMELMLQRNKYTPEVAKKITACIASDECILSAVKESQKMKIPFDQYVTKY